MLSVVSVNHRDLRTNAKNSNRYLQVGDRGAVDGCGTLTEDPSLAYINGSLTVSPVTASQPYYFVATPIILGWQNTDLELLSSASTPKPASAAPQSPTPSATSFVSASPTTTLPTISGTLPSGAKAGVGAGVAVGGIAAILIGWFVRLRTPRRHKSTDNVSFEKPELDGFSRPELYGESLEDSTVRMAELDDAGAINEVNGSETRKELDSQDIRAELPDSHTIGGHEAQTVVR